MRDSRLLINPKINKCVFIRTFLFTWRSWPNLFLSEQVLISCHESTTKYLHCLHIFAFINFNDCDVSSDVAFKKLIEKICLRSAVVMLLDGGLS